MTAIVSLLQSWWTNPVVYEKCLFIYNLLPAIIAPAQMVVNAPYGRFSGHFLFDLSFEGKKAWCLMEAVSPLFFAATLWFERMQLSRQTWQPVQTLLSCMFLGHYIHRSFIYPWRASSMAPIHIFTVLSAIGFNVLNGYTNGYWTARHAPKDWRWVSIGTLLWAVGLTINVYHDTILFRLRRARTQQGERYFIPQGGLFAWVSCPNYLGELIEWTGFAIAASPSEPAYAFALGTAASLIPRAIRTHGWYKDKFNDYPPSRKAIVPFLY